MLTRNSPKSTSAEPNIDSMLMLSPRKSQPENKAIKGTMKLEPETTVASSFLRRKNHIVHPMHMLPITEYRSAHIYVTSIGKEKLPA
jgi:hypothetical protein